MKKEKIESSLMLHLEEARARGYEPVYLALQGSQNYGLDWEQSDVDTRAFILPSFQDVILNKAPVSTTIVLENNEHLDIKDIRLLVKEIKKQNLNSLEVIFTPYFWINRTFQEEFVFLRARSEEIARMDKVRFIRTMVGLAHIKAKGLEKITATTAPNITKFGYEPKELHHLVRIREFLEGYCEGKKFGDCLVSPHREYLLKIKRGDFSLRDARVIRDIEVAKIEALQENFMRRAHERDEEIENFIDEWLVGFLKKTFLEESS